MEVITMSTTPSTLGCIACWPSSADAAYEALKNLQTEIELVDESHFTVKIRSCTKCEQLFVSVFTETIDWQDGDDPQCWSVMPLTPEEAQKLSAKGGAAGISALPTVRQSLCHDAPKGSAARNYWCQGIAIRPHD